MSLADGTVHVDYALDKETRDKLENDQSAVDVASSVHSSTQMPHPIAVTCGPGHARSNEILRVVVGENIVAEPIGI
jgi:hypothetical protein